jgi:hypothetical protein
MIVVDATAAFIVADRQEKGQALPQLNSSRISPLLAILGLVVASFAVDEELDTADGDGADEEHVNVTALMQNKLQDKPKYH